MVCFLYGMPVSIEGTPIVVLDPLATVLSYEVKPFSFSVNSG